MYIKEILEYQYNYAEFIVSDGIYDIVCMDLSVPLPNGIEPAVGMEIASVLAFSFDCADVFAKKIARIPSMETFINKDSLEHFRYTIQGRIADVKKAIVTVGNISICLLNIFPHGFEKLYNLGETIRFVADRLDCIIKYEGVTIL